MRIPGNVYIDNPAFPLLQASITYWGITDFPGNAFGTTLFCTDLTNQPNYTGLAIKILDGGAAGQVRPISSDIAGVITVAAPWTDYTGAIQVIAASTRFVILSTGAGGGVPPAPPPPSVGLWMFGHCSPAMGASDTTIVCPNLAGLGDDILNDEFWCQAIKTTIAATERQIRRITDYVSATGTFTVDSFANNVSPGDDVAIFHESILSVEILGFGTLTTSSATVPRDNTRAEGDDYFNGAMLMPTEGADRFQPRRIVDYDGTGASGTFTLDPNNPLTAAPGLVDYVIIGDQTEFVPATDATINRTPSDVIGSKADTADYTRAATQSSLVRLIKGILGSRVVAEGTLTLSSATVPEDNANAAIADSYNGLLLMPIAGACAFLPRRILDWTAGTGGVGTGIFTIDPNNPFPAATGIVLYIVIADQTEFVPTAGASINRTPADVVGNKTEPIPAMNLAPGNDAIVSHLKAILERLGATPADPDDSVLTNLGQRDDAATADTLADITTTSIEAKLRLILNRMSPNAFAATVNGNADTALDDMIAHLAAYFVAAGAAWSVTVNPGTVAKTDLITTLSSIADMLAGATGIGIYPAAAVPADGVNIAEVLRQIYNDATLIKAVTDALQDLTRASGTITATGLGTEDNVYYNNAPAANYTGIVVLIDLTSMGAGDQATIRESYRIKNGGNYILKDSVVYNDAQSPDLIRLDLEPNRYGAKVTIEATVARTFDWEVFTIE